MLIDILSENIEYEVANDFSLVNGTSLQGTVNTTYSTLENLFGKPTFSTGDPYEKTQMNGLLMVKYFILTNGVKKIGSTLKQQFTIGKLVVVLQ